MKEISDPAELTDKSLNLTKALFVMLLSAIFQLPFAALLPFLVLMIQSLNYCFYTIIALALIKLGMSLSKYFESSLISYCGCRICIIMGGLFVSIFYISLFMFINNPQPYNPYNQKWWQYMCTTCYPQMYVFFAISFITGIGI